MENDIYSNDFLERITSVVPTKLQIDFLNLKYYNFIHFGLNTFTSQEWGNGKVSPKEFKIEYIDTDKWVKDLQSTGSKGVIFTAKHHDGFCLFNSKYTTYSIKNTIYKGKTGDLVLDLANSCKKYNFNLGIYLSPWDRHEPTYGTSQYNDYFCNQLEELCTKYGNIFCFWFDGACGEGESGKKQEYDWCRYFSVIRKYQPNAIISNCGPDIRWIGNEKGIGRESEFSVVPTELTNEKVVAINSQTEDGVRNMQNKKISERETNLGSREQLLNRELCYKPSEMDISVTNIGWFYRKSFELFHTRSVSNLLNCYYNSVGNNATLLINVPPNKKGELSSRFIKRLYMMNEIIEKKFQNEVSSNIKKISDNKYEINFEKCSVFSLVIGEDINFSQRVEEFKLFANEKEIFYGKTIGFNKICDFDPVTTNKITLEITKTRNAPVFHKIKIY